MGNFEGQQAERDHLYGPPAVGQEERDVFITTGFTGGFFSTATEAWCF